MMNHAHATPSFHLKSRFGLLQLSYSHIKPIGCRQSRVPKAAPAKETNSPKTGIALARIYETKAIPAVQQSHTIQWVGVLLLRWWEPFSMRTKMNLAGT